MNLRDIKHILRYVVAAFCVTAMPVQAAIDINEIRAWAAPGQTLIVFDMEQATEFTSFGLQGPDRIVLDLKAARLSARIPKLKSSDGFIVKSIRTGKRKGSTLRVVLDMNAKAKKWRVYDLPPNREYGHRIVVELDHVEDPISDIISKIEQKSEVVPRSNVEPVAAKKLRDIVIAIDAGHGGEDPGAHGRHGTREKHVVLKIARKLHSMLLKEPGFKPVLIRNGDYYVSLRDRISLARKHKADLFVSIHADAFKNPRVKGSSVFILSPKGGSDEAARWLAARENSADLVGGVKLTNKDDVLASVLLDLSLTGTIDASGDAAGLVLNEISRVGPVHNSRVQSARFVVLKSPDIPSMLVETAFISNPREERRLKSPAYQRKLASAMRKGIKRYFAKQAPPDTYLAMLNRKRHTIQNGETLSSIAQRYRVGLGELMRVNNLRGEIVKTGQVIKIPSLVAK